MTFYTHQSWDCVGTSSHNHSLFSSIGHIIIHEIIFVLLPPTNISILARVKINDELVPRQDKRLKSSPVSEKKKRMKEKSRHWWNSFKNNKAHNSRCGLEKILNGFWNSWNGLWFGFDGFYLCIKWPSRSQKLNNKPHLEKLMNMKKNS